MPHFNTHTTPNPNSIKITANGRTFVDEGMVSFNSAAEASDHDLGSRLFSVPGIANVFALPDFVTVTKHPAADWDDLIPKIEGSLGAYFAERDGQ